MLETRDVPGATELEAPSHRPPIRGVNETPHSTSPKPAVRIVRKLSPDLVQRAGGQPEWA
jgi:hypothetical protein